MTPATITIETDQSLKRQAQDHFKKKGTDLETAVLRYIVESIEDDNPDMVILYPLPDNEITEDMRKSLDKLDKNGYDDFVRVTADGYQH